MVPLERLNTSACSSSCQHLLHDGLNLKFFSRGASHSRWFCPGDAVDCVGERLSLTPSWCGIGAHASVMGEKRALLDLGPDELHLVLAAGLSARELCSCARTCCVLHKASDQVCL